MARWPSLTLTLTLTLTPAPAPALTLTLTLTPGEMAITLSHRKAWDACIDSNLPACLIFEDDFTAVGPELRRRLDTAVALLPHDWQFLQLGRCWDVTCDAAASRVSPDADLFRADQAQMGTCFHAYAMTRKGAFELRKVRARVRVRARARARGRVRVRVRARGRGRGRGRVRVKVRAKARARARARVRGGTAAPHAPCARAT